MATIKEKRMKSIKEKANEVFDDPFKQEYFEAGANYVLEKFVDIVNKNTKPNGMEDRAQIVSDMIILIKQLKK